MTDVGLPLADVRVLDLTRVRAGPAAVRQLADWGADVVKIERPGDGEGTLGGPRHGPDFQNLHRNKRSLALDLKHPEGRRIFFALLRSADVVVENYRPDVKHRLGIDYGACRAVNARVVYASISGFGQDGPYGPLPGFDQIAQGMGGLMSVTGAPGQGPMRAGIPVADLATGLYTAFGILAALHERSRSGEGQWVQCSLLQSMVAMMDFQAERWLLDGEVPQQAGNNHPTGIPTGVFATADGHINIAATGREIFSRFCEVMGHREWLDDERFATPGARLRNRDVMNAAIEAITKTRSSSAWIAAFNAAGVPAGPIYAIDEVFADPQVRHLRMAAPLRHPTLGDVELVSQPLVMSRTPLAPLRPAPEAGEHTEGILAELGLGADEIARLRVEGAVGVAADRTREQGEDGQ